MPRMTKTEIIECERSSGNVFADLGLADADELFTRAQIGFYLSRLLKSRTRTPRSMACILNIAQLEVSPLLNGQFNHFTTDTLFNFLRRLEQTVTIHIRPHRRGEPYQEVSFAVQSVPTPQKRTPSEAA